MMTTVPTAIQNATGPNLICRPACAMVIPALRLTSLRLVDDTRRSGRSTAAATLSTPLTSPRSYSTGNAGFEGGMVNFQEIAAGAAFVRSPRRKPGFCRAGRRDQSDSAAASTSSAWPATETLGHTRENALVRPDQDGRADNTEKLPAVHRFFAPDAIGLQHAVRFVRGERDGQRVFGFELVLCRHRIGGDAENVGFGLGERALLAARNRSLPWCSRACRLSDRNRERACVRRNRRATLCRRHRGAV